MLPALLLALIALLTAAYFTAPVGQIMHASRTREMIFRKRRFPMAALYKDPDGRPLLTEDRMLGRVSGESCSEANIHDGDVVVARKMSDSVWMSVEPGDVVVINSPVGNERDPMRLRVVKERKAGKLIFADDSHGTLEPKSREFVAGKVEFAGSFGR